MLDDYRGGNVEEAKEYGWNEMRICAALSATTYIESSISKFQELFGN